ncbi:MAG: translation initiation factor IF-2 [Immundisolibacterales bacterium]|nr:translation initiation factor IF-2 [Immundisolibacterales bacterium]
MAEVSVREFSETVGTPIERLLAQLSEAGLPHAAEADLLSEQDKEKLLSYLRRVHGKEEDPAARSPRKKITLKRRQVSEISIAPSPRETRGVGGRPAARKRTVKVDVLRSRTYVRPSDEPAGPTVEVLREQEAAKSHLVEEARAHRRTLDERLRVDNEARAEEEVRRRRDLEQAEARERELAEERAREEAARAQAQAQAAAEAAARGAPAATGGGEAAAPAEPDRAVEPAAPDAAQPASDAAAKPARKDAPRAPAREPGRGDARRGDRKGREDRERRKDRGELHVRSDRSGRRRTRPRRQIRRAVATQTQHIFERPTGPVVREVSVPEAITVGELAHAMSIKAAEVLKTLMNLGSMMTINQTLDQDTATLVVEEMGHIARQINTNALEEEVIAAAQTDDGATLPRAPVVTVMGHVDHGKTSLLDRIRSTDVAAGEAGGITQHIGAYHVETEKGAVTFLDTPGHAAFTAMRARGSRVTDIVILVVAADDGVMPQTDEAVQHSKAAGVPIVVAVNKIDREDANPERVMQELAGKELVPEPWGGDTIFVNVSALTGEGVDELLGAVLLQAELLEIRAPVEGPARGTVIESRLDRGRGPVATVLVQGGTLQRGEILLAGSEFGKVRGLVDERGRDVAEAGPSMPVEVLGLSAPPEAGDEAVVVPSERKAREIASLRHTRTREQRIARQQAAKLENVFSQMGKDEAQNLNIVLKADVQGSAEALGDALQKLSTDEVRVNLVSSGIGGIRETDVNLAIASGALIVGFNTRADTAARRLIEREGGGIRYFSVIYDVIDMVRNSLSGMLAPEVREEIVGLADVRDVFRVRRFGAIAGCLVVEGTMRRNLPIRVLRDEVVIFEGELESLRRFKEDVSDVVSGTECGIGVRSYDDVQVGDRIEAFRRVEMERTV